MFRNIIFDLVNFIKWGKIIKIYIGMARGIINAN